MYFCLSFLFEMALISIKGMGVALITPFKKDGSVDYTALERVVDYQLHNKTDYLVVLGTTAETPTLSDDEQSEIIRTVVRRVKKQIPIVLGIGGNNTRAVVDKLKKNDLQGIDAILSVVPYYNKPTQEGIYRHFKAIAEAAELPVVLYNVPGRTGVNMTADTTLRLANEFKHIIGIKEASGNLAQICDIIKRKPEPFQVVSGDDSITLSVIREGGCGIISVIGNAFPKQFGSMVHQALSGDFDKASVTQEQLKELFELLFTDGNPAGVKSMLHLKGYIENELRLPLVPATGATYEEIRTHMDALGFLSGDEF